MLLRGEVVLATLGLAITALAAQPPVVQTRSGRVEGLSRDGIEVFRGIPFAAPPVGELRWRDPQPPAPWAGVLDATRFRPACMQLGTYPPDAPAEPTSEDCLFLNIWRPAGSGSRVLPVMVWIYGGGLVNGSGAIPLYGGDQLARRGVLVVTINYRLGVFGFLALPELTLESGHHSSGDYGLLDQVAALRWVHDNIAAFGGDADNVTVFGQSSGSISISALTASPLAAGLFERAIGESGGLFEPMSLEPDLTLPGAERQGQRFMARAGASSLAELRREPAATLIKVPFDANIIIDDYFLPRSPYEAYARGELHPPPLLVGWNADEGRLFVADRTITVASYRTELERSFPAPLIRLLAPAPGNDDQSARAAAARFNTDMRFRWDMWTWARLATRAGEDDVFVYEFTRAPPYPPGSRYFGLGATHGLEIQYVFDHLDPGGADWSAADHRLARAMSSYWTSFARSGDPNSKGLEEWPRFDRGQPRVLRLGKEIRARPMGDLAPLRRISRVYRAARFLGEHWQLLLVLVVVAGAGLLGSLVRLVRRRRLADVPGG